MCQRGRSTLWIKGPGVLSVQLHLVSTEILQVCQICCSALVNASAPIAQVVCPFDRTVTLLAEPCVLSLKKNYALIEIIERHKKLALPERLSPQLVSAHRVEKELWFHAD